MSRNGSVSVTLFEEDGGSAPDNLGTIVVPQGLTGRGDQSDTFTDASHARYRLDFHVHE